MTSAIIIVAAAICAFIGLFAVLREVNRNKHGVAEPPLSVESIHEVVFIGEPRSGKTDWSRALNEEGDR